MAFQDELDNYKQELCLCLGEAQVKRLARPMSKFANPNERPNISSCFAKLSTIMTTTYLVESTFSYLGIIKNKYRSNLLPDIVDALLCCAVEKQTPDFSRLLNDKKQFHPSH